MLLSSIWHYIVSESMYLWSSIRQKKNVRAKIEGYFKYIKIHVKASDRSHYVLSTFAFKSSTSVLLTSAFKLLWIILIIPSFLSRSNTNILPRTWVTSGNHQTHVLRKHPSIPYQIRPFPCPSPSAQRSHPHNSNHAHHRPKSKANSLLIGYRTFGTRTTVKRKPGLCATV